GCAWALDAGRSTLISTVASGAATMKMISRTSMTSMNGVTLISWLSTRSSSPPDFRLPAMIVSSNPAASCACARHNGARCSGDLAIKVAADKPLHRSRRVRKHQAISRNGARESVVDHHGRNRGNKTERCCKQCLGNTRCDNGKVGRLRLADANKRIHDAP